VTPNPHGEREILFLPDPKEIFDEDSPVRRDNVRLAQYDHPIVHQFLGHAETIKRYEESCTNPDDPREMTLDLDVYESLYRRQRLSKCRCCRCLWNAMLCAVVAVERSSSAVAVRGGET